VGFFDRIRRLSYDLQREEIDRELDKEDARAEGISPGEFRRRRSNEQAELSKMFQGSLAYHEKQKVSDPRVVARVKAAPAVRALYTRIGALTVQEFEELADYFDKNHPLAGGPQHLFPGSSATCFDFTMDVLHALQQRAGQIGIAETTLPGRAHSVVVPAAVALAVKDQLAQQDLDRWVGPWRMVVARKP
jgi:hypothetical protein